MSLLTAARAASLVAALVAGAPLVAASFASSPAVAAMESKTIVDVAASNKDFSTLVAAVKAAGLVETLSGPGPFTVFAPTNAAFAKLPKAAVADLLKPENKDKLTALLTYHVVAGKFTAKDVVKAIKDGGGKFVAKTVQGEALTFALKGRHVTITDAKGNVITVTKTDVGASNGVIHVIDGVLSPG